MVVLILGLINFLGGGIRNLLSQKFEFALGRSTKDERSRM